MAGHTSSHTEPPLSNPKVDHERVDIDTRTVTATGVAIGLLTVAVGFGMWFLFDHFLNREAGRNAPPPPLSIEAPTAPPEPRLQASPPIDLKTMRQEEDTVLKNYAWIDPDRGVVRIPIDRAMELVAHRGAAALKAQPIPKGQTPAGRINPGDTAPGRAFGTKGESRP